MSPNLLFKNVKSRGASAANVITEFVRTNPVVSGGAIALGGAAIVATAVTKIRKKPKKKSKKKTTRRKPARTTTKKKKRVCKLKRKTPRTAGKRKDTSTKRIRYTKKGQPYIITKTGKAKFIKKCSAKRSHKQKGGRY